MRYPNSAQGESGEPGGTNGVAWRSGAREFSVPYSVDRIGSGDVMAAPTLNLTPTSLRADRQKRDNGRSVKQDVQRLQFRAGLAIGQPSG